MAEDWKNNRGVASMLAVAVVAVWSFVGYRVMTGFTSDVASLATPARMDSTSDLPFQTPAPRDAYRASFADPFRPPSAAGAEEATKPSDESSDRPSAADSSRRKPLADGWTLVGTVDETAMIQRKNGDFLIVKDDTRIEAIQVRAVADSFVIVADGSRVDTLHLR